ncbi:MAG: 3-hydroxylacyl-ACP dehydratase [Pseudomonadota bacterium]
MLKDRAWIMRHIPHQGSMCLLDGVIDWDPDRVCCVSRCHRSFANPLRANDQLSSICGIEFAAQAIAVHGALIASESHAESHPGFLASVRGVVLNATRLDDLEDDLLAMAIRINGDDSTLLYEFSLSAGARVLLSGRAAIVINASGFV